MESTHSSTGPAAHPVAHASTSRATASTQPALDLYDASAEAAAVGQTNDIGVLVSESGKVTESDKYNILKGLDHWAQDNTGPFPKMPPKCKTDCYRAFKPEWRTKFPWLVYSKTQDGCYCSSCVLFCTSQETHGVLVVRPWRQWSKSSQDLRRHDESIYHREATVAADHFKMMVEKPARSIEGMLKENAKQVEKDNLEVLKSIIACILFLGQQGMAFRANDESVGSANRGNFIELLEFRASTDPVLKKYLDTCPKNASYCSPDIQNELISLCAAESRRLIVDEVKEAKYFTIIADEVSDVSNKEQVALVVRYTKEDATIKEKFVDFKHAERTTGVVLAHVIQSAFESYGLDLDDCRGQAYDGASNMSSSRVGVQGIISQQFPKALYVHCTAHVLNLVIVGACSERVIKNMNGSVSQAALLFNLSPKRQSLLEKVICHDLPEEKKKKLKDLCRTRWVYRHEAYETFLQLLPAIMKALEVMSKHSDEYGAGWNWDAETTTRATGLLHAFQASTFLVAFYVVMKVMAVIKGITIKLQQRALDVVKAYRMVEGVILELEGFRSDPTVFAQWFEQIESLAETLDQTVTVPRQAGRQAHRSNQPHRDPKEYYEYSVYNVFLDHVIVQMRERFGPVQQLSAKLLLLIPSVAITLGKEERDRLVTDMWDVYETDLPTSSQQLLTDEAERWVRKWSQVSLESDQLPSDLPATLKLCDEDTFPNLHVLIRIGCTLPVTSAESERANSALKFVKTILRNKSGDDRLSSLVMLKVHGTKHLNVEAIARRFCQERPRRLIRSACFNS